MDRGKWVVMFIVAVLMTGCATIPPGPSVMVMPAPGKSFEAFQSDDSVCRGWAQQQSGWDANQTVNQDGAGGAAIGALMGAGLGAAIGAASGNPAQGAAIGAAAASSAVPQSAATGGRRPGGKSNGATTMPTSSACMPRAIDPGVFPGAPARPLHTAAASAADTLCAGGAGRLSPTRGLSPAATHGPMRHPGRL